jgi:hypothetical protein
VPSFGELKDAVVSELHGQTTDVPIAGSLLVGIDDDTTEIVLDFGDQPGAARPNGIVEIGNELLYVTQFNKQTGLATVPPWGRGFRGTTAAAHDVAAQVTVRPRYPRKRVGDVINEVIQASCPPLYAAKDLAVIQTGAITELGYALPADCTRVLRVEATEQGPVPLVRRGLLRDWTVRTVAGTQLLEINRDDIFESIQVTYAAEPARLVADTDDFATVTGLTGQCSDLVTFGAIARLILSAELARQQVTSVEAAARNPQNQSGSATTISRYFQALYQSRLDAERDRLQAMYPIELLRRG